MNPAAVQLREQARPARTKPANFDRLARVYRWLEWLTFGPVLWRCRCTFLEQMQESRTALVIGDGDGRFTARLLQCNPNIHVEAIDASEAMLHQLVQRAAGNANRVHVRIADARAPMPLSRRFDHVVTHFFLDCLTTSQVETLARNIRETLEPGTQWIVSEFAVPQNLYGRLIAQPLVSGLYLAFGLLTGLRICRLPHYRDALRRAGFEIRQERKWLKGLLVSEVWQAL